MSTVPVPVPVLFFIHDSGGLLDPDSESGSGQNCQIIIILLFSDLNTIFFKLVSDFYNILSFNRLLLMRKSYSYEVIKKISDSGKK